MNIPITNNNQPIKIPNPGGNLPTKEIMASLYLYGAMEVPRNPNLKCNSAATQATPATPTSSESLQEMINKANAQSNAHPIKVIVKHAGSVTIKPIQSKPACGSNENALHGMMISV